MRRKIVVMLSLCLIALSSSCFAMTFSQPIKLGSVLLDFGRIGGYMIEGATDNNGAYYKGNKARYGKGIAQFGTGSDALYIHYDFQVSNVFKIGDKNTINTVSVSTEGGGFIYQIKTDTNVVIYPIGHGVVSGNYAILGKQKDGKFIKYIVTEDISQRYFGTDRVFYHDLICKGDTIIIPYEIMSNKKKGEFRFKWDDAAQWFGIEQVVY